MPKWKSISLRQELVAETEKAIKTGRYRSLSEFVSEAVRLRLEELRYTSEIPLEKNAKNQVAPEQLLYTPQHTWAQMITEGNIRVGLSQYAQEHLEGIAYVYIDPQKKKVTKMEQFGVIETWLFMFNLHSPVSGKIFKFNKNLRNNPHLINKDPYNEGWIVEIQAIDPSILEQELKDLLTSRQYHKWTSKLENRLKVK